MNLLNFFASASKAKRSWKDPIKIFVWTVRNNFKFITETDERRAETALKSYRRKKPEAFYFLDSQGSESLIQPKAEFQELILNLSSKMSAVA